LKDCAPSVHPRFSVGSREVAEKKKGEISELIEAGFEYICENNGLKFFRKPK
jgi:hypothetical protein